MKERYVDGFVLPLRKDRVDDYKKLAEAVLEVWKEHGALEYWECIGDDLEIEGVRSFLDLAKCGKDETAVFAWVVFESREARDAANEKIMNDPRMLELMDTDNPIFDCARMAMGGFRGLVGEQFS
ncbi:MAG: DUF1428 domain-containing protein [Verrucomicrobiales bacterium]|nr:DUF1428 domain-containing protein [Verrucomicrobiales bacterium]